MPTNILNYKMPLAMSGVGVKPGLIALSLTTVNLYWMATTWIFDRKGCREGALSPSFPGLEIIPSSHFIFTGAPKKTIAMTPLTCTLFLQYNNPSSHSSCLFFHIDLCGKNKWSCYARRERKKQEFPAVQPGDSIRLGSWESGELYFCPWAHELAGRLYCWVVGRAMFNKALQLCCAMMTQGIPRNPTFMLVTTSRNCYEIELWC